MKLQTEKTFANKKNGGKHYVTFKSFRMEQKGGDSAGSGLRNSLRRRRQIVYGAEAGKGSGGQADAIPARAHVMVKRTLSGRAGL